MKSLKKKAFQCREDSASAGHLDAQDTPPLSPAFHTGRSSSLGRAVDPQDCCAGSHATSPNRTQSLCIGFCSPALPAAPGCKGVGVLPSKSTREPHVAKLTCWAPGTHPRSGLEIPPGLQRQAPTFAIHLASAGHASQLPRKPSCLPQHMMAHRPQGHWEICSKANTFQSHL